MSQTFKSDFTWHGNALKGIRGPVHDGEPMHGGYRGKNRRGALEAWYYWIDGATGALRHQRNGKEVTTDQAMQAWLFVNADPISDDVYWHFIDTGKWPDGDDAAAAAIKSGPDIDPATDPVGSLKAEIEKLAAGIAAYEKIESDEAAAKGQTLRSELTTLKGKAVKLHKAEKDEFFEAGRAIDRKWFPLRDLADENANKIKKAQEDWNDVKLAAARRAQEETDRLARIAREEAEAAENIRLAEIAKAAAEGAPLPSLLPPEPAPPPRVVESNAPPPSSQMRGASGRAASVSVYEAVTIDDELEVYKFLAGDPDLTALLLKMAQQKTNAGMKVPGTHTTQKSKVK